MAESSSISSGKSEEQLAIKKNEFGKGGQLEEQVMDMIYNVIWPSLIMAYILGSGLYDISISILEKCACIRWINKYLVD